MLTTEQLRSTAQTTTTTAAAAAATTVEAIPLAPPPTSQILNNNNNNNRSETTVVPEQPVRLSLQTCARRPIGADGDPLPTLGDLVPRPEVPQDERCKVDFSKEFCL